MTSNRGYGTIIYTTTFYLGFGIDGYFQQITTATVCDTCTSTCVPPRTHGIGWKGDETRWCSFVGDNCNWSSQTENAEVAENAMVLVELLLLSFCLTSFDVALFSVKFACFAC